MSLKADRKIFVYETNYVTEAAVEAGRLLTVKSGLNTGLGSGQGIRDQAGIAVQWTGAPNASHKVIGVSLAIATGLDQTKFSKEVFARDVQIVGEPHPIGKDGYVWTDAIVGEPRPEDPAYLGTNGAFDTTQNASLPAVGKFKTSKDQDGYAKVYVKLA